MKRKQLSRTQKSNEFMKVDTSLVQLCRRYNASFRLLNTVINAVRTLNEFKSKCDRNIKV